MIGPGRDLSRPRLVTLSLLTALLVAGLGLLALDAAGQADRLRDTASLVIVPAQSLLNRWGTRLGDLSRYLDEVEALRAENEALRRTAERLVVENLALREAAVENEALRRQLNFSQANPDLELVAARVVGLGGSGLRDVLTVDRGERQGIQSGMPVITTSGLVGQVLEVHPQSAMVLLLTDPASSINARIQSSRATGAARGVPGGGLSMGLIQQEVPVRVGDIVLTSGLGGTFPSGLVIGHVAEVRRSDAALFQEATLVPAVASEALETVMIVVGFEPQAED
ncbi:MAG: rod shape-determining protein MreC [Anaerolineae bacterium]